jgi:hypothetical protein
MEPRITVSGNNYEIHINAYSVSDSKNGLY